MDPRPKKNRYKAKKGSQKARMGRFFVIGLKGSLGVSGLVLLSAALVFVHDFITQAAYFKVKTLSVQGTRRLSRETVLEQAKIRKGTSALGINLGLTRRRLLAHPWIVDATVKRQLPSGVEIRIQEEDPLALVEMGDLFLVNRQGEIFKKWSPSDPQDLPIVRGLDFSDVGVLGAPPSAAWKDAMAVLRRITAPHALFPGSMVQSVHADPELGITLCLFDGGKALHLGHGDFAVKLVRFREAFLRLSAMENISDFDVIDVRERDRIVVIPVRTGPVPRTGKEA